MQLSVILNTIWCSFAIWCFFAPFVVRVGRFEYHDLTGIKLLDIMQYFADRAMGYGKWLVSGKPPN